MENVFRQIEKIHNLYEYVFNTINPHNKILNKSYCDYLIMIYENPGITQNDLVNYLNSDKTTVSKALKMLESNGYIIREKDSDDKRSLRIFPYKEHINTIDEIIKNEDKIFLDVVEKQILSEDETNSLIKLLYKLESSLDSVRSDSINKAIKGIVRKANSSDYISINHLSGLNKWIISISEISEGGIFVYDVNGTIKGILKISTNNSRDFNANWYFKNENVFVDQILVSEDSRGFGIGKKLLDFVESFLKYENTKSIKIFSTKENISLQKLLNKINYKFAGYDTSGYFYEKNI
jgi:DNA-binding MarR family transcriptional regulator/GNAT superfamily N-acetyltransferase